MILQLLAFQILIFLSSPANITAQPLALLQSDSSSSFRNVTTPFPFGIGEDSYCFEYWSEMTVESDVLQSSREETAVNVIHRPIFDFQRSNEAITEYVGLEIPDFFFSQARETYIIAVIGSNELVFIVIHSTGFVICGSQFLLPEIPASLNLKGCKFFLEGAQNVRVSYLVADGGKYNHSKENLRRICQWEEGLSIIPKGWFIGPDASGLSIENFANYAQFYRLPEDDPCLGSASFYGLFMIAAGTSLGALFLVIGRMWLCTTIKKIKDIKLKEKFFKRNGGLLLQQMFNSSDGVTLGRCKLFNSKDIERAINNFDVNRILGQGGQGTVYKGMLEDGRIIAVKKSKVVEEEKLEEFINELVILSQVNHRNVVKLLGCCLETEVPLLVYEFIPNGTLSQYINDQNEEFPLTWEMRLRIAIEVAGALAYLHSAAAIPIYHRDVKSTNILLDEKCRAKVADFGTSKFIAIDQTHLTTKILGTFGYLDPEYHQSSQLTDKSDVYSFGVVLVELLTGKKPIFSTTSQENVSLAAYFIHFMKENRLNDILDDQMMESMGKKSDRIMAFANLTRRCLDLNGKKRPTMDEVSMELKGIRALKKKRSALFSKIMKKLSLKEMK